MNLSKWLLVGVLFIACKEAPMSSADDEMLVQLEQTVTKEILGTEWIITFVSMDENSLCPKGMQCIWAGRFIVTLQVNGEETQLGAGDLFPKDGEMEVAGELLIDGVSIKIEEVYDAASDESIWIKLKFTRGD